MKISIILEALTGLFETDMKRASKTAQKEIEAMRRDFKKLGAAVGAEIAVAATALTVLVKKSIDAADAMRDMSQKFGIAVPVLSSYALAAEQAGTSIESLGRGMQFLAKNAVANGDALAAMGIKAKNADGSMRDMDDLFGEIAGKFAGYKDGAEKAALAQELFGKAGAELIPLLNQGSEGLQDMRDKADALGVTISADLADAADQFNDNLSDLRGLATGFGNDLATALLPTLNALSGELVQNGIEARKTADSATVLADSVKVIISAAVVTKNVIESLWDVIFAGVDILGGIGDSFVAAGEQALAFGRAQRQAIVGDIAGAWETLKAAQDEGAEAQQAAFNRMSAAIDAVGSGIDTNAEDVRQAMESIWTPAVLGAADATGKLGEEADRVTAPIVKVGDDLAAAAEKLARSNASYFAFMQKIAAGEKKWVDERRKAIAQYQQSIAGIRSETAMLGLSGAARREAVILMEAERLARAQTAVEIEDAVAAYVKELTALEDAADAADALGKAMGILERVKSPFAQMTEEVEDLRAALKKLGKEGDAGFDRDHFDAINESIRVMNAQIGIDAVGNLKAAADAMAGLFEEGTNGQKRMQQASAVLSVVQAGLAAIEGVRAVMNQSSGDPYSAFGRMAAMAAAVAPLLAAIGSAIPAFSGGSSDASEQNQASQGTGSVLGDWDAKSESMANSIDITAEATQALVGINRGMLSALLAMQSGIGGASASIARVEFGGLDLAGGLSDSIVGGWGNLGTYIHDAIFGGDQDLIDQGILIVGGSLRSMIDNIVAGAYQTIETDGGWFGSDDIDDEVTPLSDAAMAQLRLVLSSIGDAVREGAEALGLDMDAVNAAIDAFHIEEIRISTMDLTGEEARAELEAVFSSIFDGLAGAVVPFIDQFQRVGEGLGETLIRVATSVQVMQEGIIQLGLSMDELDPESMAQVSVALIEAAGGIEAFISGMQSFVASFAPEAHLFAVAQDEITRAFEQVGLELPTTRDGLWELMQSLDATTESGREQIAAILRLAGVADEYYDGLERQADEAAEAARDEAEALEEAAEAARDAAQAAADLAAMLGELSQGPLTEMQQDVADINAQMAEFAAQANELAIAAGRAGASEEELGQITAWAARQFAMAVDRLRDRVASLRDQLQGTELENIDAEIAALTSAHQEAQQAADAAAAAAQQRYEQELAYLEAIAAFVESLKLSALSPLNPQQQFNEAQAQFQTLLAAARGGDLDALGQLQGAAQALLEQGQGFLGPSDQYTALFDSVIAALSSLGVTGQPGGTPTVTLVPSDELEALFARREEILLEQEERNRAALAEALAIQLGELSMATRESAIALAEQMGISLTDLVTDLGISLENLSAQTGRELADVASVLNLSVTELANAVGASLGELTETNSLLNDAFEAEIADLPEGIQDELQPLLRNVEDAVGDADANAAIALLRQAVDELAPEFRDELAPYLDLPATVGEPIADMAELLAGLGEQQVTLLDEIRDGINFLAFGITPPESPVPPPAAIVTGGGGSAIVATRSAESRVEQLLAELIKTVSAGADKQARAVEYAANKSTSGRRV